MKKEKTSIDDEALNFLKNSAVSRAHNIECLYIGAISNREYDISYTCNELYIYEHKVMRRYIPELFWVVSGNGFRFLGNGDRVGM